MAKKSFFERLTGVSRPEIDIDSEENKKPAAKKENLFIEKDYLSTAMIKKDKKDKKETPKVSNLPKKEQEDWLSESEGQLTIDIYQTPTDIVIKSTIAGVKGENIDISITNDMVTIKGKREKDEEIQEKDYYYQECYWGPFARSVILPVEIDADNARASMKNGILTIRLPKIEKIKTKKLSVKIE